MERAIAAGEYDHGALDEDLIRTLHTRVCADLVPHLAGWRRHDVQVGQHTPTAFSAVPAAMRDYARDLSARLAGLTATPDHLLENLACAEGRLLSIHPFADFNGRAPRLFLRLLLRRLDLPDVDLVPDAEDTPAYLAALRAADRMDWQPLAGVWRQRFEKGDLA